MHAGPCRLTHVRRANMLLLISALKMYNQCPSNWLQFLPFLCMRVQNLEFGQILNALHSFVPSFTKKHDRADSVSFKISHFPLTASFYSTAFFFYLPVEGAYLLKSCSHAYKLLVYSLKFKWKQLTDSLKGHLNTLIIIIRAKKSRDPCCGETHTSDTVIEEWR